MEGGSSQPYLKTALDGGKIHGFSTVHPNDAGKGRGYYLEIDLATGSVTSGATSLGNIDGSAEGGNSLPASIQSDLEQIAVVSDLGTETGLIGNIRDDGEAFIWEEYATDLSTSKYFLYRLTGTDRSDSADWTRERGS